MKKKWMAMLVLAGALTLTAACGKEADSDTASSGEGIAAEYPDSSVTRLGKYDGVEIAAIDTEVTDEELQAEIDNLLASYPETVPVEGKTVVEDGDTVNIDFVGKLDGEAFEGGSSGEGGYDLTIGSGSFIDGFEDGLIGKEVGTSVELPLTFPEDYNSDLAGQDVIFEVTINSIIEYVTPEWTDAFVQENTDYDSIEAYETATRESLQEQKEENAVSEKEYSVMQAIIDDSEFDCAESDLQTLKDTQTQQYETYASYYGVGLEDFLTGYMQTSMEEFEQQITESAEFQLKCMLAVEAIGEAENMTLSDEEYQEGLEQLATEYGAESAEAFEEQYGRSMIENSLLYDKIIDFVTERAVEI